MGIGGLPLDFIEGSLCPSRTYVAFGAGRRSEPNRSRGDTPIGCLHLSTVRAPPGRRTLPGFRSRAALYAATPLVGPGVPRALVDQAIHAVP